MPVQPRGKKSVFEPVTPSKPRPIQVVKRGMKLQVAEPKPVSHVHVSEIRDRLLAPIREREASSSKANALAALGG